MNTKMNTFRDYRTRVNIPLHDVAYLLKMDVSNLSKVERGTRPASIQAILLYHVLFKVPLLELYSEQYDELKNLWSSRSISLTHELAVNMPLKSKNRIAYIESFVNRLITREDDRA